MERRQRFIVGVVTAAITFGSLLAFINPHRFDNFGQHRWAHHSRCEGHFNSSDAKGAIEGTQPKQNTTDSINH